MAEIFRFFKTYELVIYLVIGISGIMYLWRFWGAWQELKGAIYGLERESAQRRLNQTTIILALLLVISVTEFMVVSFIVPGIYDSLPTPTLDMFLTPGAALDPSGEVTALPTVAIDQEGCVPGQVMITSPIDNAEISGEVEVRGSASIPGFGFFKVEWAQELPLWHTIQAGRDVVEDDTLVEIWDTSLLPPGDYILQLIVTDADGVGWPPCRIRVRISSSP